MWAWLREYLEIQYEFRERNNVVHNTECKGCDILKTQLEIVNDEKRKLIDRILERPQPETRVVNENPTPIMPRHMPWAVKRQILEAEDRKTAALMKDAPKPDVKESTEDLEKELNLAEQTREGTRKEG